MASNILLVVIFACMANAAIYREKLGEKPAQFRGMPGCYIASHNEMIPFGKSTRYSDCTLIDCTPEYIEYTTCEVERTDDPRCHVYLPKNKMRLYPECCPQVKCM